MQNSGERIIKYPGFVRTYLYTRTAFNAAVHIGFNTASIFTHPNGMSWTYLNALSAYETIFRTDGTCRLSGFEFFVWSISFYEQFRQRGNLTEFFPTVLTKAFGLLQIGSVGTSGCNRAGRCAVTVLANESSSREGA